MGSPILQRVLCLGLGATIGTSAALAQKEKPPYLREPQTVTYERYLMGTKGDLVTDRMAHDQLDVLRESRSIDDAEMISGEVGIRLAFTDLSKRGVEPEALKHLIAQLNDVFDFTKEDKDRKPVKGGLERITFCLESLDRPLASLLAYGVDLELGGAKGEIFDDFAKVQTALRAKAPVGVIPITLLDGTDDFLGFASPVPHASPSDGIAVAVGLVCGEVPGRTLGKTVAQLIANYIGLKPIWYQDSPYGDMVDDTPCHNAPNHGSYPPGAKHYSLCEGMPLELTDNYMDDTDEAMRTSWTAGQVERLRWLLSSSKFRSGLVGPPCSSEAPVKKEAPTLDPSSLPSGAKLRAFPNPVTQTLQVGISALGDEAPWAVKMACGITDVTGREVARTVITNDGSLTEIDVGGLAAGKYSVTVRLPDGSRLSADIVKY